MHKHTRHARFSNKTDGTQSAWGKFSTPGRLAPTIVSHPGVATVSLGAPISQRRCLATSQARTHAYTNTGPHAYTNANTYEPYTNTSTH